MCYPYSFGDTVIWEGGVVVSYDVNREIILDIKEIPENNSDGYEIITTHQTIRFVIDNDQQCCENFGYVVSEDDLRYFIGSELYSIWTTDQFIHKKIMLQLLPFDSEFNGVFINIYTSKGYLQFALYNYHNGYYGHNFQILSNQLKVDGIL